jgi:hypothetical protein
MDHIEGRGEEEIVLAKEEDIAKTEEGEAPKRHW